MSGSVRRARGVRIAAGGALLALAAMAVPSAAPAASGASVNQQLAKVKQATARYHDVAVAEADGYVSTEECVFSPDGTMGIHYVNFARLTT